MANLFAYGTLMCEEIMREISGLQPPNVPGTLKGYRRRSVKHEKYPALVPDEKGSTGGLVYLDVPDSAWDRLDRFEGEMYARRIVQVELEGGTVLPAETYVLQPDFLDHLDQSDWDFAGFMAQGGLE